jgi:CheY-like chemotaxis protein
MHKVLLVDDERLNRLVAVRTLERQGVFVVTADNGVEAVANAALERFDAIIMDCQMPTMDGFQATAAIRKREAHIETSPHTPIIGLSARAMDGDREAALAAGMDDYLTKPLRADELRSTLQRWLPGTADDDLHDRRREQGLEPEDLQS